MIYMGYSMGIALDLPGEMCKTLPRMVTCVIEVTVFHKQQYRLVLFSWSGMGNIGPTFHSKGSPKRISLYPRSD